jgi:amino acid efflux transporter
MTGLRRLLALISGRFAAGSHPLAGRSGPSRVGAAGPGERHSGQSSTRQATQSAAPRLRGSITLPQAVALYAGAVLGAGVLILPGVAADHAGPGSLLAWGFDGLAGIPIALAFAALAARFPDAGGVAAFAARGFGAAVGAVIGWFYFVAAAVAQALVALTGAHYAADALAWQPEQTFALAGGIVALAVGANLYGLQISGPLQLVLSGAVALVLLTAAVAAIPRLNAGALSPFLPQGWESVGRTAVLLFFAFFGWEAITRLSAEFRDPHRDVPRATIVAATLVTVTYLSVAFAVVTSSAYGRPELDRVAVARVLSDSLGGNAKMVAAAAATIISLATANAFVAATSRLGYALGRDGALPAPMARLSRRDVPAVSVLVVGAIAGGGLLLAYLRRWGAEAFLAVPNSLVIIVYLAGMAAGVRLLAGPSRLLAGIAAVLCLAILPFAGVTLLIPATVTVAALAYRFASTRRASAARATSPPRSPPTRRWASMCRARVSLNAAGTRRRGPCSPCPG